MTQCLLHVNGQLVSSAEEFKRENGAESAQAFAGVPGLLWKIAYVSRDGKEAGGIYLFSDESHLRAFTTGPIVAQLVAYPKWKDVVTTELSILVDFSKAIRAPIGSAYELNDTPLSFAQMADQALHAVPTIKPADLQRRLKKEPDLLVIDVRDAIDLAKTGTVAGAVNLSLGALTYLADHQLPPEWRDPRLSDHARPIVTTCIEGPLGAIGGKLLHDMGFTNVQILEGGANAWSAAGLPMSGKTSTQ